MESRQLEIRAAMDSAVEPGPYVGENSKGRASLQAFVSTGRGYVVQRNDYLYGGLELVLQNKLRILLVPTKTGKNRINVNFVKDGGLGLVDKKDCSWLDAYAWNRYFELCGFNDISLGNGSISPYIDSCCHGIRASAASSDMDTVFRLLNMYLTRSYPDKRSMGNIERQADELIDGMQNTPDGMFRNAVRSVSHGRLRKNYGDSFLQETDTRMSGSVMKTLFDGTKGALMVVSC